MENTIPPGKPSSQHIRSRDEAAEILLAHLQHDEIARLLKTVTGRGELYLVGGMVRDAWLRAPLKDLDFATSLRPVELERVLGEAGFRVIETGIEHGTLTILAGDESIEITTFRKPSRREETEFGDSIEEDLGGRDFTINAIAFCPARKMFIDPFLGVADLENRLCKAVGDSRERFREDPHRLLRMVRFGPAQGREIATDTKSAAEELAASICQVSPERIREELSAILMSSHPHMGVLGLKEVKLLDYVLPELLPTIGCEQNEWHIHDVFEHTLWVLERSAPDKLVRFACLLHDIAKPDTLSVDADGRRHFYKHEYVGAERAKEIFERLKFSKAETRAVVSLVREHMRPLDCGESGMRRIMRDLGEEFDRWLLVKRADAPPVMPEHEFEEMYEKFLFMVEAERSRLEGPAYGRLAINGSDLLEAGFAEGPTIGKILAACEELVIEDPEKNQREILLEVAANFDRG